jgi:hypothetical protein
VTDRKLTGSSGEHYVCYALTRKGWVASLTRDGLERTDILAVHTDSRRMIEVQVKSTRPIGVVSWLLGAKGLIAARSNREWYVFVELSSDLTQASRCYVVPRDHVAAATWIVHQNWLTSPEAKPGTRNTPVSLARVNTDIWRRYESRWDLLELDADRAPVMLPGWLRLRALEHRVGLPPSHPWNNELPVWETDPMIMTKGGSVKRTALSHIRW